MLLLCVCVIQNMAALCVARHRDKISQKVDFNLPFSMPYIKYTFFF